ncbi:MAG: hypothetical protein HeimC3_30710 [Candidatus Heimdallarchaeota archaeon LC_3]|nr:MAG: hypothetical protein HeimC3_30710 [Candidatus Heimdallarchaeota archaeon LC_3]
MSHTHQDKEIAERIKGLIETSGAKANLLTYEVDPSQTIIEKVKNGIKKCDLGIILWTKNSEKKEWIIQEAGALAITEKPIIVLMESSINPPGAMLEGIHYVRFGDIEGMKSLVEWLKQRVQNEELWKIILILGGGLFLIWYLFSK